ncbi:ARI4B protein, partial [Polypterus senegalus]
MNGLLSNFMYKILDQALEFLKDGTVPSNWRTELKGDSSSSEEDEEEGGEEDVDADASSEEEEEEEVEPYPDERENFLQQLYKFMEDRGTPINKRPVLGYRNLNLFKLYRLVHNLGGFDNIDSGSVWKQVYQDLGIPVLNSAAGYNVKCAYRKYLYGFEEYCKSTGIKFQMALPEKIVGKPSKHLEEEETLGESLSLKPEPIPIKLQEEEAEEVEDEKEGEEETFIEPEQEITKELNLPKVEQINEGEEETDEKIKNTETPMLNVEKAEHQEEGRHAETSSDKLDDSLLENVKEEEEKENFRDESFKAGEGGEEEEEEEFECYPPGMKVQVRYGRGKNQKLYEASIKDSDLEGGEVLYLVHYCGWNVRYDEWIKADKIVRPADKNVPKIKHRKKIKSKIDKEKDKAANPDTEELLISKNSLIRRLSKSSVGSTPSDSFSKLDGSEGTENDVHAVRSLQLTDIINGLQGSESSGEESEHEEDYDEDDEEDNDDGQQLVKAQQQANSEQSQIEPLGCSLPFERWEIITPLNDCRSTSEKDQDHGHPSVPQQSLKTDTCEQLGNLGDEKRKWEDRRELPPKPQLKRKCRSSGASEWLRGASPERSGESAKASAIGLGSSSSSSGSSSSDDEEDKQPQVKEIENNKVKSTPSKKHNGLEEKRKCVRPAGFWDAMEKRPKLLSNSEDRLQNSRSKGQKDVWSSIQGQWPKKTLKELFSDSDTEAANSPPSEEFKKEPVLEEKIEKVPVEGKSIVEERGDKRVEFPSSGSNSVLNTPPTTPESPSLSVSRVEPDRTPAVSPPPTLDPPPPPPLSIGTGSSTLPHPPVQEESVGGRSETDSSTVEVESLGGELQELQSEGAASPVAFDTSLSSSSNSNSSININKSISSGSPPGGTENREKVLGSQKRPKEVQGGGPAKKLKRSQKNTAAHHKKSRKSTQTSDSEDQSAGENPTKVQLTKAAVSLKCLSQAKCTSRLNLPGKCSKHHDLEHKELNIQTQRAYKWSFQMAELEKMSSVDRIAFLQDKLQEIRQHYLSLKSEVASIDRRRKRLKKKERESETRCLRFVRWRNFKVGKEYKYLIMKKKQSLKRKACNVPEQQSTSDDYVVGQVAGCLFTNTCASSTGSLASLFKTESTPAKPVYITASKVSPEKRPRTEDVTASNVAQSSCSVKKQKKLKEQIVTLGEQKVLDRERSLKTAEEEKGKLPLSKTKKKSKASPSEASFEDFQYERKKKKINWAEERLKNKRTVFVGNLPVSCNEKHDHKKSIFVGNLAYDVKDEELREHFLECGEIEGIRLIKDRNTGLVKGFGYILFKLPDLKDGEAVQKFFLEEIQLGEELLAQGDYEKGVDHLTNAIAVCGQPQQLLHVLQQTLPPPVFQMLLTKLPTISQVCNSSTLVSLH